MARMTRSIGGAALSVPGMGAATASSVPESAEVARYATARMPAAASGGVVNNWQITESTNPQATAAEVSRRQAFAGASA